MQGVVRPRSRPLPPDYPLESMLADWKGERRPEYCPVCGLVGCLRFEQEHPFGDTFVTEYVGHMCRNCGDLAECATCGGWFLADKEIKLSDDCLPYLCDCKPSSASPYDPGTLGS